MEAAKAGPERPATKLSRKERQHAVDVELCGRVGEDFGLALSNTCPTIWRFPPASASSAAWCSFAPWWPEFRWE